MNANNRKNRTVDRIAVTAMFAVAILILATFALTARSAVQPIPAALTIALSTSVGMPMCAIGRVASFYHHSAWSH